MKSMADKWFGIRDQRKVPFKVPDTTSAGGSDFFSTVGKIFKTIFLDYDKIDINITQTNSANNPGVFGGTGLDNFWSRGAMFRDSRIYSARVWHTSLALYPIRTDHTAWLVQATSHSSDLKPKPG